MKLERDAILYINELENLTKVQARDCIIKDKTITYVIDDNQVGKAIGKNGNIIKQLSKNFAKKIEIVPFFEKPEEFIKNYLKEGEISKVDFSKDENDKSVIVIVLTREGKRKILGNSMKLKKARDILQRSYNINGIKIIGN